MTMTASADTIDRERVPPTVAARARVRLLKPDRPRPIDRYIDYFGERRDIHVRADHRAAARLRHRARHDGAGAGSRPVAWRVAHGGEAVRAEAR